MLGFHSYMKLPYFIYSHHLYVIIIQPASVPYLLNISRNWRHKIYLRHRSPWVYCEASDPLFCVACRYILSRWWLSVLFSVVVHEIRVQNFLILVNLRSKTRTLQFTTCHQKTWLFSSPCKFLYCPPLFPSSPSLPPAPPGMDSYSSSP